MIEAALALLPAVGGLLPFILGGGGLASLVLGLLPNLRTYAMIGLGIVAALAIGFGLWERGNYESEVAAFSTFKEEQAKAVLAAQQKADALSDKLIVAQAAATAATEKTATTYVDRIIHDAPPPAACGPSDAARDGSRAVHDLLANPGGTAPQRSAPTGTPAAKAGPRS